MRGQNDGRAENISTEFIMIDGVPGKMTTKCDDCGQKLT